MPFILQVTAVSFGSGCDLICPIGQLFFGTKEYVDVHTMLVHESWVGSRQYQYNIAHDQPLAAAIV